MITIDLLPDDLRKVEHTPYPRLIVILLGVVTFVVLVFLNINLYFIRMPEKKEALEDARDNLKDVKGQVTAVTTLEKELEDMRKRRDTVVSLVLDRVRFAKKLDLFADVVEKFDDVWFSSMAIKKEKEKGKGRRKKGNKIVYSIALQGHTVVSKADNGIQKMAEIQNAFKEQTAADFFYNQISEFNVPQINILELEGMNLKEIYFPVDLTLDPSLNRKEELGKKKSGEEDEKRAKKVSYLHFQGLRR